MAAWRPGRPDFTVIVSSFGAHRLLPSPAVPGSHRAPSGGPGVALHGRRGDGRTDGRADGIPGGGKGLKPLHCPGRSVRAPSGPSTPSAAIEVHPGAARGRPMAPPDRAGQRNKAITRGKQLFSQIRPPFSQICHADRHQLGALSAGEVCPQFARCGCRRGSELHSYSRWAYASGS